MYGSEPVAAHNLFREKFRPEAFQKLLEEKFVNPKVSGSDGIKLDNFQKNAPAEIQLITQRVKSNSYKFTRYKEKLISKGSDSKPRIISIPTYRDRLTLRILTEFLMEIFPECKTLPPHNYIKAISDELKTVAADAHFVRLDVKSYYPSIDRDLLLRAVRRKIRKKEALGLIERAIKNPTTGKAHLDSGVPQGLSISNILASLYLHDIDTKFKSKYSYYRYVDDILIITGKDDAKRIFNRIRKTLNSKKKLVCHDLGNNTKSQIASVTEGTDYLGFRLTKEKISVRKSSFRKMIKNLISVITRHKYEKNEEKFLWKLNLKISGCKFREKYFGWMFFFRQTEDKSQLKRLDDFLYGELKRRGLNHLNPQTKKFIRAYHEIRFNLKDSNYFYDFDKYDSEKKRKTLVMLGRVLAKDADVKTDQEIDQMFEATMKREVESLERELMEGQS